MKTTKITYIGHSTLLIEIDGVRLLTDPLLRPRVGHLRRAASPIRPQWHDKIDAVLISHPHWDHLDIPSLRLLGRGVPLVAPYGTAGLLRRRGFTHIQEIGVGEQIKIGGVRIVATYADHSGNRPPFGPRTDCLGFLIEGNEKIYFAGDTDMFPRMAEISRNLDVALLPVWGWGPTLGSGHMTPARAAKSLGLLRPEVAIPIHWGTFHPLGMGWLSPRFLWVPPRLFAREAAEFAPDVRIEILQPGDETEL